MFNQHDLVRTDDGNWGYIKEIKSFVYLTPSGYSSRKYYTITNPSSAISVIYEEKHLTLINDPNKKTTINNATRP